MFLNCGAGEDSRDPWDCKEIKLQSILKEISIEYSLAGLILKLKLQYFGHLMQRANSLEKMRERLLGKIKGKRRRRGQRTRWFDSITDSMDEFEQAPGDGAS